jgi:hypothetical protein
VPTEGWAGLHVWVIPAWFPTAASGFNPGMPDVVSLPGGKERDREFLVVMLSVEGSRGRGSKLRGCGLVVNEGGRRRDQKG